jgi:hypothetical protein
LNEMESLKGGAAQGQQQEVDQAASSREQSVGAQAAPRKQRKEQHEDMDPFDSPPTATKSAQAHSGAHDKPHLGDDASKGRPPSEPRAERSFSCFSTSPPF